MRTNNQFGFGCFFFQKNYMHCNSEKLIVKVLDELKTERMTFFELLKFQIHVFVNNVSKQL